MKLSLLFLLILLGQTALGGDLRSVPPSNHDRCKQSAGPTLQILGSGGQYPGMGEYLKCLRIGQKSIVFSGDHNGNSNAFIEFARGSDVLVMHMPVPENISSVSRKLHAPPGIIGKIAKNTTSRMLVLSHFMARSLNKLVENLEVIRSHYDGPMLVLSDLDCLKF